MSHARPSHKINRPFVKTSGSGDIRETSVHGWDPEKTQLRDAVGDNQEPFEYIQKGRTGFVRRENPKLISQVKTSVDN